MTSRKLTDAEWQIMNIIWENGPTPPREIVIRAGLQHSWKQSTVYTMISRLVKKGMLENRDGMIYPLCDKNLMVGQETKRLIKKVGSAKLVLSQFISGTRLSGADMAELRTLIDSMGAKGDE